MIWTYINTTVSNWNLAIISIFIMSAICPFMEPGETGPYPHSLFLYPQFQDYPSIYVQDFRMLRTGLIWLSIVTSGGKEHFGSANGGEFLEQLSVCWLFRKDSAPWSLLLCIRGQTWEANRS